MKTAQQRMPVSFYEDTTSLIRIENEQLAATKSIVINMGLGRKSENSKNTEKYSLIIVGVTIVAEHGKLREMISLPLYKHPAWLYPISTNKVKPVLSENGRALRGKNRLRKLFVDFAFHGQNSEKFEC